MTHALKRILTCLLCAVAFAMARADNAVSITSASGEPGTEVTLSVGLKNTDVVTGVQLSIPLPDALSYVDESATLATERTDGHRLTASVDDGVLKFVVYSFTKAPLRGNDGAIITFRLRIGKQPGAYALTPEVVLGGRTSAALPCSTKAGSVTIIAPQLSIATPPIDFGRVPLGSRQERQVTVTNVGTKAAMVTSVTIDDDQFTILPLQSGGVSTSFTLGAGASRTLTIVFAPTRRGALSTTLRINSDAVTPQPTLAITADPFAVNELHLSSAEGVSDTEVTVSVTMNNMDPIVGAQWSMMLPPELQYVEGSAALNAARSNGHIVSASCMPIDESAAASSPDHNGSRLTFVIFSAARKALKDDDGTLLTFRLRLTGSSGVFPLRPEQVTLGSAEGTNVVSATTIGTVTIASPCIVAPESMEFAAASLTATAEAECRLRNDSSLPLTITAASFHTEGYCVLETLPLTIAPRSEAVLHVEYRGTTEGPFASTMNVYSDDPSQRMVAIALSGTLYEPNTLALRHPTTAGSAPADAVVLDLTNYSVITGLQADIRLIDCEADDLTTTLSERLRGFSYTLRPVAGNAGQLWRLVVFSFSKGKVVDGHDGALLQLVANHLRPTGDMPRLTLENVVLSGENNLNRLTPGSVLALPLNAAPATDANGDGKTTIVDVTLHISRLKTTSTLNDVDRTVRTVLQQ